MLIFDRLKFFNFIDKTFEISKTLVFEYAQELKILDMLISNGLKNLFLKLLCFIVLLNYN